MIRALFAALALALVLHAPALAQTAQVDNNPFGRKDDEDSRRMRAVEQQIEALKAELSEAIARQARDTTSLLLKARPWKEDLRAIEQGFATQREMEAAEAAEAAEEERILKLEERVKAATFRNCLNGKAWFVSEGTGHLFSLTTEDAEKVHEVVRDWGGCNS